MKVKLILIRRLHDLGVMINGSFVFGMEPYPGTALYQRLLAQERITIHDWNQYDTRHTVFRPALMSAGELERGYWRAYRDFYRWGSIARGATAHANVVAGLRHLAYAAGWKKFEPLWDLVIRAKRAGTMLPVLETILGEFGRQSPESIRPETSRPADPADTSNRDSTQRSDGAGTFHGVGIGHRRGDCPYGQDWR
jgi:hypothetical protein